MDVLWPSATNIIWFEKSLDSKNQTMGGGCKTGLKTWGFALLTTEILISLPNGKYMLTLKKSGFINTPSYYRSTFCSTEFVVVIW